MADVWESNFYLGGGGLGDRVIERHIECVDQAGTTRRPFTVVQPWDPADAPTASFISLNSEQINFNPYDGTSGLNLNWSTNTLHVEKQLQTRYTVNNYTFNTQRNAADTLDLNLPFIDAANVLNIQQPVKWSSNNIPAEDGAIIGITIDSTLTEAQSLFALNSTHVHGAISLYLLQFAADVDGRLFSRVANTKAGSNSARMIHRVEVNGGTAGNAYTQWTNNVTDWSVGLRNDDGDALYITPDYWLNDFGGTPAIRIDASTKITKVSAPFELASYTVATLPSAAVAARLIYVTDEAGGAVPAFSDGANYRRVTDRAIVS
jgi:hypothetical protein